MPRRIVFVCTGNSCRSPLAEVLARARYADLPLIFASAGTDAVAGQPASPEACAVATGRGLDLGGHRATPLDAASLAGAVWVIGMTRAHVALLRARLSPAWPGRVGLLGLPGFDWRTGRTATDAAAAGGLEVPDPWQQPPERYGAVAALIDRWLLAWHDVFAEASAGKDCPE
ncbi:MAG: low molecular weight protein arginine phosphatase [bacterium]|nr:low molecular weight protein arginine phosphatase [bacterium]